MLDTLWQHDTTLTENDPGYAKDDKPLQRNGDATSIYPADADYTVDVVVEDDAGNQTLKTITLDGGGRNLDTRRPLQVKADAIGITPLPFGVLKLQWDRTYQDTDAAWFYVYSDSGKGGNVFYPGKPDSAFGSLRDREPPDCDTLRYNCWTSDPLQHGKTYKFVVRTVDNCGNFDLNTTVITGMADAIADKACVQWPATGGNFGPGKPLSITATTTATDILNSPGRSSARKTSVGSPVPGTTVTTLPSMAPPLSLFRQFRWEILPFIPAYTSCS